MGYSNFKDYKDSTTKIDPKAGACCWVHAPTHPVTVQGGALLMS